MQKRAHSPSHQRYRINKTRKRTFLFIIIFTHISIILNGCNTPPDPKNGYPITAAAVQLQISDEIFASPSMFKAVIRSTVEEAFEQGQPDIIIFPEYTSAFLALFPYMENILHSKSIEDALTQIQKIHPELDSIQAVFKKQSSFVKKTMLSIFGELAREFNVMIVAGTYFAEKNGKLFNRLVVYNATGFPVYTQDKVFLSSFEKKNLKLSSGNLKQANGLYYLNRRLVFTINQDSLQPVWSEHFGRADIWIDIKANSTEYTKDEEERSALYLPARVVDTKIPYGITVCLTGTLLNIIWEGKSSVLKNTPSVSIMAEAQKAGSQEVIVVELPQHPEE